ncbi:DNA-binding response regulator, partial [Porticoccaceae bacterium]|nr:DNA-binding response regulator [Porticoccaceae bacterium]
MPKHRILIVDDEASIRDMLSLALEAAGFNVLQAENAQ